MPQFADRPEGRPDALRMIQKFFESRLGPSGENLLDKLGPQTHNQRQLALQCTTFDNPPARLALQ